MISRNRRIPSVYTVRLKLNGTHAHTHTHTFSRKMSPRPVNRSRGRNNASARCSCAQLHRNLANVRIRGRGPRSRRRSRGPLDTDPPGRGRGEDERESGRTNPSIFFFLHGTSGAPSFSLPLRECLRCTAASRLLLHRRHRARNPTASFTKNEQQLDFPFYSIARIFHTESFDAIKMLSSKILDGQNGVKHLATMMIPHVSPRF